MASGVLITTTLGPIEVSVQGPDAGLPVLVLHGSPGGLDGSIAMSRFLHTSASTTPIRTICLSRPGYLNTPLDHSDTSIDHEADLLAALLDALSIPRASILAWSGGGAPAYRLAVRHPSRITSLVAIAAVSAQWVAPKAPLFDRLLFQTVLGEKVVDLMVRKAPEHVIKGALEGEGSVRGAELEEQARGVLADEEQRRLVLETAVTMNIAGRRKAGWDNDVRNYALIEDLGLREVKCPVLLVHGDADTDALPEYSMKAHEAIPGSEVIWMERGGHLAFYAHQRARKVQERAVSWLVEHRR